MCESRAAMRRSREDHRLEQQRVAWRGRAKEEPAGPQPVRTGNGTGLMQCRKEERGERVGVGPFFGRRPEDSRRGDETADQNQRGEAHAGLDILQNVSAATPPQFTTDAAGPKDPP